MARLEEVFGVSNDLVKSYVVRPEVNGRLTDALGGKKHIVVYGASKQGKTSLIHKHLDRSSYTKVLCEPTSTRESLYQTLLREVGFKAPGPTTVTQENTGESVGLGGAKLGFPGFGVKGEVSKREAKRVGEAVVETPITLDVSRPQDVYAGLAQQKAQNRRVVFENFHYLREEVQQELAFDLRTWNDLDVGFVILGIWKQDNYLLAYNGDLADRVVEVPVEPWTVDHFDEVSRTGAPHLNIQISAEVIELLANEASGSIGIFQELLKVFCRNSGVTSTVQGVRKTLDDVTLAKATLKEKAAEYGTVFMQRLLKFARSDKPGRENPLYLKQCLVSYILSGNPDNLETGVRKQELLDYVVSTFHTGMDRNVVNTTLGGILNKLEKAQYDLKIPSFVSFSGGVLRSVDPMLSFYLRHANLDSCRAELKADLLRSQEEAR